MTSFAQKLISKKSAAFFTLVFQISNLYSVGIMTEYRLAKRYLEEHPMDNPKSASAFLLGVWIPDTQYLVEKDLAELDKPILGIEMIHEEKDPIKKGILFHTYLWQFEKEYFKEMEPFFNKAEKEMTTWKIVVNVLQDSILGKEEHKCEAIKLINETLYTEFDINCLTKEYQTTDLIKWFYTVFMYINTDFLETYDHCERKRYKGMKLSSSFVFTDEILKTMKHQLPKLSKQENVRLEICNFENALVESFQ